MSITEVTLDSFESFVSKPGIAFLDCWAEWCPPCRAFKPVFEAAATQNPEIAFGSLNTQQEQVLASELEITSIPTIMAFRDGILVYREPGAMPAKGFAQLIQAVQDLDMAKIQAS
ncbi:MAG: thioredoxin family protein [Propionibacteriaceae bacterium]|jgi:thioredoxin 1|nr:thioredoxin family protein [Propionibacteriaceae bacterium]